jgi:HK97 family phage major capsid protein
LVRLGGLTDSTGQPIAPPAMLASMKLVPTSQAPIALTVGTSTDCSEIYVGDFSNMVFGMRENLSIQVLQESYAGNGQIGFLCHARLDVAVLYPKAFAVVTGVR